MANADMRRRLRRPGLQRLLVAAGLLFSWSAGAALAADDLQSLSLDDKQWVMAEKNYAATRYSSLDQINAGSVGRLQVAWTFSIGQDRGQEAAPLIIGDTMYVVGPFPNRVFALDATNGDLKWSFLPDTDRAAQGVACCDVVN